MITITQSSQVIFLLGAGASKKAGVPTTNDFVTQFIKHIEENTDPDNKDQKYKLQLIKSVVKTLEGWKKRREEKVDIELLLETLTKFKNRNRESLLQFCVDREDAPIISLFDSKLSSQNFNKVIDEIISELKNFIRSKTIVKEEKRIEYLKPFRGFIETAKSKGSPLDIISLNYDTCIEKFCNVHKMTYQDGFDLYWNPESFNREETEIRLYKLHGSIIWYQSDRGTYIKLPIQNEIGEIKLISDEKAENLMLYPMQKWDYAEPLLELILHIKDLLESKVLKEDPADNFKFLIAVGYSFRDEHVKKVIWDAARKNRKLYLIIIDPEANKIYERLKYYDKAGKISSHLSGKVICLPYRFEEVFPLLMDTYIRKLKEGLLTKEACQRLEDLAKDVRWIDCLSPLAEAECSEMVDEIINNKLIVFNKDRSRFDIDLFISLAINYIYNDQKDLGELYLKKFYEALWKFFNENFKFSDQIDGSLTHEKAILIFRINSINDYFYTTIKEINDYCRLRLDRLCIYKNNDVEAIANKMKLCLEYMEIFSVGQFSEFRLNLSEYVEKRNKYIDDLDDYVRIEHFEGITEELINAKIEMAKLEGIEAKGEVVDRIGEVARIINGIEYILLIKVIKKILDPGLMVSL